MKTKISYSLLAAAMACGMAQGQTTAYTTPVGYVSLGDTTPLADACPSGSEITLSIPLLRPLDFQGTASSSTPATATTVTLNQVLVAGQFNAPTSGAPWVVETGSGIFLPISSNTASTITVVAGDDDLSGVLANDAIRVRKAWTVGTLLPAAGLPDNVQLAIYDVQPGENNSPSTLLIQFGGGWFNGGTGFPADDTVLYPGESFVLINETATDIADLIVSGEVPLSNSRVRISKDGAGAQDTRISYFTPVEEPIGEAGFAGLLTDNDQLFVYDNAVPSLNKSASTILVYFGGNWFNGGTGFGANDFPLTGGQGYVLRRDASAPIGDVVIANQQTFIPSL